MFTIGATSARIIADENRREPHGHRMRFLKHLWQWEFFLKACNMYDGEEVMPQSVGVLGIENLLRKGLESHHFYKCPTPYLLVYHGHGYETGWAEGLTYEDLTAIIVETLVASQKMIIINDTCYGFQLSKHLEKAGFQDQISLLCPADAEGLSEGEGAADILQSWMFRQRPEEHIHVLSDSGEEKILSPILQWGARFDEAWFLGNARGEDKLTEIMRECGISLPNCR